MATTYIVLERTGGPLRDDVEEAVYTLLGSYFASGPEQAIKALAGEREGRFAAVPVRNWTEIEREQEQPPPRFTHREVELAEQLPLPAPVETKPAEEAEPVSPVAAA
jgi:hypothetical protein